MSLPSSPGGLVAVDEIRGSDLYLRVTDDGPGIPREVRASLFQRGITAGKAGGTGLGLAYVQQVMHVHGGSVKVLREGKLTIFECHLPSAILRNKEDCLPPESQLTELPRVAICFEPPLLGSRIAAALSGLAQPYIFQQTCEGAEIVMSGATPDRVLPFDSLR